MRGLDGRVALVTGATGVIGGAVSRRLASEGALVVVASRSLDRATAWIAGEREHRDRFVPARVDLAERSDIEGGIAEVGRIVGMPNILVAAASSRESLPPASRPLTSEDFRDLFGVDVAGHYFLARQFVDGLPLDQHASVVFLSSIYAHLGVDARIYPEGMAGTPPHYAAVKGGVEGLVGYLAAQWGGRGVRVNAVVAGGVANPARQNAEFVRRYTAKTMIGRLAHADEIAAAVAFLASDDASYITGAALFVDGGMARW